MDIVTDVDAALTFAADHLLPDTIELNTEKLLVRERAGAGAESWQVHDRRLELTAPRRSKGTVNVHDADSFQAAVTTRELDRAATTVYADEETMSLVAVLNDDHGGTGPGWRDYRVALALRVTPEWKAWKNGDGLTDQATFAERIEDGLPEITNPDGATLLEIAQTFQATIGAEFQQGTRLRDGRTQFAYVEEIKATASSLEIPDTFELAVQPFIGSKRYAVTARLRYRVATRGDNKGTLTIGYQLIRADEVERLAFTETADAVRAAMPDVLHLAGPAPAPVA